MDSNQPYNPRKVGPQELDPHKRGFRLMFLGEVIRGSDEVFQNYSRQWVKTDYAGDTVQSEGGTNCTYRTLRPPPNETL